MQKTVEEIREEPDQEVRNSSSARRFLLEHQLVPPDVPLTLDIMSNVLMSLTQAKGISGNKTTQAVLRSVAYILNGVTHDDRTEKILGVIDKKLDERMETIQTQLIAGLDVIVLAMKEVVDNAAESMDHVTSAVTSATANMEGITKTYKQALTQPEPTPHNQASFMKVSAIDPRLRAREGVRQRQILVDLDDVTSKLRSCSLAALVDAANKAIGALEGSMEGQKIVAATRLMNGGILLEANSAGAAVWLRETERRNRFVAALDPSARIRSRLYPTIAQFVPISFDPDNLSELQEIEDNNGMERGSIGAARWIKPVNRRQIHQTMAHLAIRYSSPEAANQALLNGIFVCGTRVMSIKGKREPIRCLKCHGWDHMAGACTKDDRCGTCGGDHRTSTCNSRVFYCTPCGANGHASWSRDCPTFTLKCALMDKRLPENCMPYYPTDEEWTQVAAPTNPPPFGKVTVDLKASNPRNKNSARAWTPTNGSNAVTARPDAPRRFPSTPSPSPWDEDDRDLNSTPSSPLINV